MGLPELARPWIAQARGTSHGAAACVPGLVSKWKGFTLSDGAINFTTEFFRAASTHPTVQQTAQQAPGAAGAYEATVLPAAIPAIFVLRAHLAGCELPAFKQEEDTLKVRSGTLKLARSTPGCNQECAPGC